MVCSVQSYILFTDIVLRNNTIMYKFSNFNDLVEYKRLLSRRERSFNNNKRNYGIQNLIFFLFGFYSYTKTLSCRCTALVTMYRFIEHQCLGTISVLTANAGNRCIHVWRDFINKCSPLFITLFLSALNRRTLRLDRKEVIGRFGRYNYATDEVACCHW